MFLQYAPKCLEKIIQHLIADQENILGFRPNLLNDPYHDAGLFVSDLKKLKEYKSNFEWIVDDFRKQKNTLVPKKQ
jgi:hypothetical protein